MLLVFGSLNVDMLFQVEALPRPGETVLCPGYELAPGGKGANQAAAAARAGAAVRMVGRVGEDAFGRYAREALAAAGVDCDGITLSARPTGIAVIGVDRRAENQIIVASGANLDADGSQIDDALLRPGTTLLCQNEVPPAATFALLERAKAGAGAHDPQSRAGGPAAGGRARGARRARGQPARGGDRGGRRGRSRGARARARRAARSRLRRHAGPRGRHRRNARRWLADRRARGRGARYDRCRRRLRRRARRRARPRPSVCRRRCAGRASPRVSPAPSSAPRPASPMPWRSRRTRRSSPRRRRSPEGAGVRRSRRCVLLP